MGKYNKRSAKHKGRSVVGIGVAVILVLLLVILVIRAVTTDDAPGNRMKELAVLSVTEQDDSVLVETTYGTVKYPFAFSEIIAVEAETFKNHAVLSFKMTIDGMVVKLYALQFNGTEGTPVGMLEVDGKTYTVTSQIYDEKKLSDDTMLTFYAAQETINDVLRSLSENEGFTVSG